MTFIKKGLLFSCLLLLPFSAAAQEDPRIYTIKKGDTLWGISRQFMEDPYYWPNLWSHNPFVKNPHFIYPGQKVTIYDGKLVFLSGEGEVPPADAGTEPSVPALPEPQEEIVIKTPESAEGFITPYELSSAGTLVDTTDNRLLMAENDVVFIKIQPPTTMQPGDFYSLVNVGDEIRHPVTGRNLGRKVSYLGQVQIKEIDPPLATAEIVSSGKEITRGARLIPSLPRRQSVALKKASAPLAGYVVSGIDEKTALGQHEIINIDLGSEDGLAEGNLLYISRPRTPAKTTEKKYRTALPDALLGAAVVVNVKPHTASALVLKSTSAIYAGDRVTTAGE